MNLPAVDLHDLTVKFPEFTLGPLTLTSQTGEISAVVGPNGSGKTTLLRTLCGLQPASSGTVTIAGMTPTGRADELLERVGYIPDDHTELLADLSATELWDLHALAHRRRGRDPHQLDQAIKDLRVRFDFDPPSGTIGGYSHGMAKKTQLIAGLMHQPPVVIFDEPHNGLDPIAIRELDEFLAELKADGAGIVIATHNLRYAEQVADRVVLLRDGQTLTTGTPAEVIARTSVGTLEDAFFEILSHTRIS